MEVLLCLVVFSLVSPAVQRADLSPFHLCCSSRNFCAVVDISELFTQNLQIPPHHLLWHPLVGQENNQHDQLITWRDFSSLGCSSWHPCRGNPAPLLTQSKSCTWHFISSSSLSLVSVGEYTQKVKMNYKLSGPAPLLIITCKSKKPSQKKSLFEEQWHSSR